MLLKNPLFAALVDQRLNGTGWTAELLANFLYNGPPEERPPGMPPYDWRNVYNTTTEVLTLLSNFLGVSVGGAWAWAGPGCGRGLGGAWAWLLMSSEWFVGNNQNSD